MTDDPKSGRPVGTRMNDYVWDGTQWVPQVDSTGSTFDGTRWHRPPHPMDAVRPEQTPPAGFAHPAYAFGLTRKASDDIAFIARWTKVLIIGGLVALALYLVFAIVIFGGLLR